MTGVKNPYLDVDIQTSSTINTIFSEGEGDKTCWLADNNMKTAPLSGNLRDAIRRLRDSVEQELGKMVNTVQVI